MVLATGGKICYKTIEKVNTVLIMYELFKSIFFKTIT